MTNQITVYSYSPITLEYIGETIAREDPLEKPTRFLIPAYATEKEPIFEKGKITKFIDNNWILEDIPLPPEPPKPTLAEAKTTKTRQLDSNRNAFCLIPIEYQGNTYATTINAWVAISYLANGLATLSTTAEYPNYPQGDNIILTKEDFKNIAGLIQAREMLSREKRKNLLNQINACTTIEQVEAIKINFENEHTR